MKPKGLKIDPVEMVPTVFNRPTEIVPTRFNDKLDTLPVSQGIYDMPVEEFRGALDRRGANRKALMEWVRSALVEGVDFGTIETRGRVAKPSLWKSGAEKICGMLSLTAKFPNACDYEQKAIRGEKIETIVLRCELLSGGKVVGEGMGARTLGQQKGDLNSAIKMCEKSALIDATLRAGGLSEIFTQDMEDMAHRNGKEAADHPLDKRPNLPPANEAAGDLQAAWDEGKTREVEHTDGKGVIAAIMGHMKEIGGAPAEVFRQATGVASMKGASLVQLQGYLTLVEGYAKKKAAPAATKEKVPEDLHVEGVISDIQMKSGTKNGKPWDVVGAVIGDRTFSTFHEETGKKMIEFYDAQVTVCIAYTKRVIGENTYYNVVSVEGDIPPEQHPLESEEVPF